MKPSSFPFAMLLILIIATASLFSSIDAFSCPMHQRRRRWVTSRSTSLPSYYPSSASALHAASSASSPKRATIEGPSIDTKPDYSSIHGPLGQFVDDILMSLFRLKLSERINQPPTDNNTNNNARTATTPIESQLPLNDFTGIIELASGMNRQYNNRTEVQEMAREVLVSLFPSFILDRYPSWFARPFPNFSARMCAWATVVGGTWLMGECAVNDVPELENGGKHQGVLVKRCRFLEESQCASICVNSCKLPTQNFFRQNMGLALTMTPDYETGECQFAYGKLPTEEEEREAREVPCLMRCPSGGGMRSWHDGKGASGGKEQWLEDLEALARSSDGVNNEDVKRGSSTCMLMDD